MIKIEIFKKRKKFQNYEEDEKLRTVLSILLFEY